MTEIISIKDCYDPIFFFCLRLLDCKENDIFKIWQGNLLLYGKYR